MSERLMIGLSHILDEGDIARVDGVVEAIALRLGERPDAWDGAGNLGLLITESLVGEQGPWTMPEGMLRANVIVTCFIMIRLMAHPMMQPILRKWEADGT